MSKQGQRVLASLRQMIVSGEIKPGQRMVEIPIAEKFNASRTPIRLAFKTLELEGLLIKSGNRGYMVRQINAKEIRDAIDVRGTLEGLAARLVAEQGMARELREILIGCLEAGDAIFRHRHINEEGIEEFQVLNVRFHTAILEASDNAAVLRAIAVNNSLPFASIDSLAADLDNLTKEYERLHLAHTQHHIIFDALDRGQSARVEAIMREHANAAFQYFDLFGSDTDSTNNFKMISAAQ